MKQSLLARGVRLAAPLGLAALAGCATLASGPGSTPESSTDPALTAVSAKPAASAPESRASASSLRPFAEVVRGAKRQGGLLATWQRDDKVWIELPPAALNKPFFLSPKLKSGIGEGRLFGGLMRDEFVIEFRRVHNQVQMIARNTAYVASAGTPTGRAVSAAFSPSLLASTAVASRPHPDSDAVLVEANALFLTDLLGTGAQLQRQYKQGYSFDARNSAITAVRSTPELTVLEVLNHFADSSISAPKSGGASVPRSLPDPRSLFVTYHYSIAKLPEQPMTPRRADARIGHFSTVVNDFSDDLARSPRQRFVNRWRLAKKDPAAAMSEPVEPITFWLDRTIPEKYRAAISAGVLEWNKAFEQIGFQGAIRVAEQPEDADWDTLDFGRASIRWMTNARPSFGAIGPSHVDPRTGEILDADIGVESLSSRSLRALRSQVIAKPVESLQAHDAAHDLALCDYADYAAEQLSYAFDVLEARGDLDPASPEAEQFVDAYLKDTTMHEVGHTLGLRHNFRSSRLYTAEQLADRAFTEAHGLTGSVMEYAPINLPPPGTPQAQHGTPFNTTLGPYDYWAIEYAYKPIAAEREAAELSRIAARSVEPQLAYGTDEDNFLGIDPESLQFDLGADVVAFAKRRVAIGRDLLARQESRELAPDEDYSVLRRSVSYALRDMSRAAGALTRQIGGVRTLRHHAGSGRDPLQPVPATEQREALDVLAANFLSSDSFAISPALQRKLVIDFQERTDAVFSGDAIATTDFSLATQVIDMQRNVLEALLSDDVAARLLDSQAKAPKQALRLSELYGRLDKAVWSELGSGADISASRRELQRDHVNRVASLLLRPGALSRSDARSLLRAQAQGLLARIQHASKSRRLSADARAHLRDSADTLSQALTARVQRAGL